MSQTSPGELGSDEETETNGTTLSLASMTRIKEKKKRFERGAERAPAARLAARRANRGGHTHLRVEGHSTSWTIYYLFAFLVCCANRHAPTSTHSIGFCVIWVSISSSSSKSKSAKPKQNKTKIRRRRVVTLVFASGPLFAALH